MKKFSAVVLGLLLVPTLALADLLEGTLVKKSKNEIVVQTGQGEQQTLQIAGTSKGLKNVQEGAKVKIEFTKKGDRLVVSEISASESGQQPAPAGKETAPVVR